MNLWRSGAESRVDTARWRLTGALVLTLAICLMAATSANAAPTWLSPGTISATTSDQTDAAISPNGDTLVVWRKNNGSNFVIQSTFRPSGGGFGATDTLSAAGQNAGKPHAEFDGQGNAIVVWHRFDGTNNVIQLRHRPAGGSFDPAQNVTSNSVNSTDAQVDMSANGTAVIGWLSNGLARAVVRSPGGALGTIAPVGAAAANVSYPTSPPVDVAMNDNGDALVSWTRDPNLAESSYRPANGIFLPTQTMTSPISGESIFVKSVVDRFGNATLVWESGSPYTIFSAFRPAGAASAFESTQTTSQNTDGAFLPQVTADSEGAAIVMWIGRDTGSPDNIVQFRYRPLNAPFRPVEQVSAPGATASYPQVQFDAAGNALAVWNRQLGATFRVQSARRPKDGNFGAVTNVSDTGLDYDTYAGFGVVPSGDAIIGWFRQSGGQAVVEAAGYDAGPPNLSTGGPLSGTTGQSLAFSASTSDVWSSVTTSWDFGDGGTASGNAVSHAFGAPGTYQVRATATDAVGNQTAATRTVQILSAPPPPPPPVVMLIPSTVSNNWAAGRTFTTVISLAAKRLPADARVNVKCKTKSKRLQRKRCPYTSRNFRAPERKNQVNLAKLFRKKKLPVGTKITVTITAPGFIGKKFAYTIRRRAIPRLKLTCLAPGSTTKSVKCA